MKQEQRRRQKGQLNSSKGTEFELNPRQCTVQRTELTLAVVSPVYLLCTV